MTTARFLMELGHDVVRVSELGLSRAKDEALLQVAQEQGRIFVTRDRDYGALVFVRRLGAGVLYLRILPSTEEAVYQQLELVLNTYTEGELSQAFVVIEPAGYRIRRRPKE